MFNQILIAVCVFVIFVMHTFICCCGLLSLRVIVVVYGIVTAEMPAISVTPTVMDTNPGASTSSRQHTSAVLLLPAFVHLYLSVLCAQVAA